VYFLHKKCTKRGNIDNRKVLRQKLNDTFEYLDDYAVRLARDFFDHACGFERWLLKWSEKKKKLKMSIKRSENETQVE